MTSWPTGSVALLKHKYNLFDPLFYGLWIARYGTRTHWFTCRSPPAERGSNSWPTRGSDQSAGWGSGRSLGSAGYFLWPSTRLPSLPPDNHLDPNMKGGRPKIDKVLQKNILSYWSFQEINKLKKKTQIGQTLFCFSSDGYLTVCFSHNHPCFLSFLAVSAWGSAGWVNASECTTGTGCWGTERQKTEKLSFYWNDVMVCKTSVLPHTLEDIRAFSSSTLVHTAGWRATNFQSRQTSAVLSRVLVSRYVKIQKRAARIFKISGLITSLDLDGLFSWRQDLL